MNDTTSIGARIRTARRERGFTQEGLAERAGISASFLAQIERGRKWPGVQTMLAIAGALGVGPSQLLDKRERMEREGRDRGVLGVRDALLATGDLPGMSLGGDGVPMPLAELERAVGTGWDLYWQGRFGLLASMLPPLIASARATEKADGPAACQPLAQAYQQAADLMVHVGNDDLAFAAAVRGLAAAERGLEADQPGGTLQHATLAGTASWVLLHQGRLDRAEEVAAAAAVKAEPTGLRSPRSEGEAEAQMRHLCVYGALLLSAAAPAAAAGDGHSVAAYMAEASVAALRFTQGDRHDYQVSFGPTQIAMQAVHVNAVLREPRTALKAVKRVIRADLRDISWGALHLDIAQASLDDGKGAAAVAALLEAHDVSEEWARHQGPWRDLAVWAVRAETRRTEPARKLARVAGLQHD